MNIIITRNEGYTAEGTVIVHDLREAIEKAKDFSDEIMIIGGAEIFRLAIGAADRLYITLIQKYFKGDTFFPPYGSEWNLVSASEDHFSKDGIPYSYLVYDRKAEDTNDH